MVFSVSSAKARRFAVAGMLLSLLFMGCERDDAQRPDVRRPDGSALGHSEAMDIFLKNYEGQKDDFLDGVVSSLLAMNDSSGIVYELVQRYGQPLWGMEKTVSKKTGNSLIVPVRSVGQDSVSAVFAFVDSLDHTYLKVFDARSADTLISDFVLLYQQLIYGASAADTRLVKPQQDGAKDYFEEITRCWHVFTSTDGGRTFHYSYSSCQTTIIWRHGPTYWLQGYASDDDGGRYTGGGGGGGAPPIGPLGPNLSGLSEQAKNAVEEAKAQLKNGPCLAQTVVDATWNNRLTVVIGALEDAEARYNGKTGVLTFASESSISAEILLHELLHAYQTSLHGIQSENTRTFEFEAWLLVDLYLITQGKDMDQLTWTRILSSNVQKGYYNWLKSMLTIGRVECNVGGNNLCEVFRDELARRSPRYSGYKPGSGVFSTINSILGKCK